MAGVVGQVSELVNDEDLGAGEDSEASIEARGAVDLGEGVEHLRRSHGLDREACKDRLVCEVLGDHGLADAVGADEDDIGV